MSKRESHPRKTGWLLYLIILLLLAPFSMAISQNTEVQGLDKYQWKNRILLLVDASPDTKALRLQLEELTADKAALQERDLIIFRVTPDGVYTSDGSPSKLRAAPIYDDYHLDSGFKGTVLIGKDGGSKLEEPFKVSAQRIFDLIDGMPMRRAEMKRQGHQ